MAEEIPPDAAFQAILQETKLASTASAAHSGHPAHTYVERFLPTARGYSVPHPRTRPVRLAALRGGRGEAAKAAQLLLGWQLHCYGYCYLELTPAVVGSLRAARAALQASVFASQRIAASLGWDKRDGRWAQSPGNQLGYARDGERKTEVFVSASPFAPPYQTQWHNNQTPHASSSASPAQPPAPPAVRATSCFPPGELRPRLCSYFADAQRLAAELLHAALAAAYSIDHTLSQAAPSLPSQPGPDAAFGEHCWRSTRRLVRLLVPPLRFEQASILKSIHYEERGSNENLALLGEHVDVGLLTLVPVALSPGLVVKDRSTGKWHDVERVGGGGAGVAPLTHMVVTCGLQLQRLTGDIFGATLHAVVDAKALIHRPTAEAPAPVESAAEAGYSRNVRLNGKSSDPDDPSNHEDDQGKRRGRVSLVFQQRAPPESLLDAGWLPSRLNDCSEKTECQRPISAGELNASYLKLSSQILEMHDADKGGLLPHDLLGATQRPGSHFFV